MSPSALFTLRPSIVQIVRTDLKELRDFDLEGAPYGYTPFCESRREMDGYRFWKSGYWASHLAGRKYHIRCTHSHTHWHTQKGCWSFLSKQYMLSCIFHVLPSCVLQCSVCRRPEEVQENSSRRSTQRTVPGAQPRPQQPLKPGPGLWLRLFTGHLNVHLGFDSKKTVWKSFVLSVPLKSIITNDHFPVCF